MSSPAFVYVAPARYEDILKLGFSHDPCRRIRSFHRRYFEYFDLKRSFAIAAIDEQDARRIERLMATRFAEHRTCAPLEIETAPGGVTEWYRGAYEILFPACLELVEMGGYPPLLNMADEIGDRLLAERDFLFEYTTSTIEAVEALGDCPEAEPLIHALLTSLDAYRSFAIDVSDYLPEAALGWFEKRLAREVAEKAGRSGLPHASQHGDEPGISSIVTRRRSRCGAIESQWP